MLRRLSDVQLSLDHYGAAGRSPLPAERLTSIELCAGAGGQALGLECAGFRHIALVELDKWACATLRANRPTWNVLEQDIREVDSVEFHGVDLVAAGVPCPPFSVAGKRLGAGDERDLFPAALKIVASTSPRAVLIENVRGILDPAFESHRRKTLRSLRSLGYTGEWRLLNASDFGVPQLRPRAILVALLDELWPSFKWPTPLDYTPPSVGEALLAAMSAMGWRDAKKWAKQASGIAPTLVGGSHKHGGPDLGPTRAREAWAKLGVDGGTLADEPPARDFVGMPRLTVQMAARLQGFPDDWRFAGKKTAAYRQVGNAFPPPVAEAVGRAIASALVRVTEAVPA